MAGKAEEQKGGKGEKGEPAAVAGRLVDPLVDQLVNKIPVY
jgi:hypothetical protein